MANPLQQPLRSRRDYDEGPSEKQSEMFKTIPVQDYDQSCPSCSTCEEEQPVQMMPKEIPFQRVIKDYDDDMEGPDGDNDSGVIILRRVFAHCMDSEFKRIRGVLSKLEDKDRKTVEQALEKIYKKYRELELSQEDDGK